MHYFFSTFNLGDTRHSKEVVLNIFLQGERSLGKIALINFSWRSGDKPIFSVLDLPKSYQVSLIPFCSKWIHKHRKNQPVPASEVYFSSNNENLNWNDQNSSVEKGSSYLSVKRKLLPLTLIFTTEWERPHKSPSFNPLAQWRIG